MKYNNHSFMTMALAMMAMLLIMLCLGGPVTVTAGVYDDDITFTDSMDDSAKIVAAGADTNDAYQVVGGYDEAHWKYPTNETITFKLYEGWTVAGDSTYVIVQEQGSNDGTNWVNTSTTPDTITSAGYKSLVRSSPTHYKYKRNVFTGGMAAGDTLVISDMDIFYDW